MRRTLIYAIISILLTASGAIEPLSAQDDDNFLDFFNPYGSLRAHLAYYGKNLEVQNNSSRLGLIMATSQRKGWSFVARGEWGINLVKNDRAINLDNNNDTGWATLKEGDPDQTIWTRLGYLGVAYKDYGEFSIGKRWSVYSDVASWTDMFDVFGGWGSGMYPGGTDGGYVGTGRAEKIVMYRKTFDRVFLGAQAQFRGENEVAVESYGLAVHMEAAPGLRLGAAWNDSHVRDEIRETVPGAKTRARALVAGLKYEGDAAYLGAIYTWQDGNEIATTDSFDVLYSMHTTELFVQYFILEDLRIHGGFNLRFPIDPDPVLPDDFRLRHYIVGGAWYLHPTAYLYTEFLYDDSVYGNGWTGENVLTLGIWMNFASPRRKN
jgi:predicted porin